MDQVKAYIEEKIVQKMITATRNGSLSEEDLSTISEYVLKHLDPVQTHDQLIGFLHTLSLKWPIFSHIAIEEEGKVRKNIEQRVTGNILLLIKQGKFNEAVTLAKRLENK
jgi:hypothetical protein